MSWLLCNHRNPRNLGDMLTSPALYDERFAKLDWCDIEALPSIDLKNYDGVIFGGGGMLYGESAKRMLAVAERMPVVLAGVGINEPVGASTEAAYHACAAAQLVGVRDWNNGYDWCPCFSCLHTAFDKADRFHASVSRWYGHVAGLPEAPVECRLTHDKLPEEFLAVLNYIGMAFRLHTDSYHGAIWARLLGTPVNLVNTTSAKFDYLPPARVMLSEHRAACHQFLDKVVAYTNL